MPVLNCMKKVANLNVVHTLAHDYTYKILVIFLKLPFWICQQSSLNMPNFPYAEIFSGYEI